MRSNKNGIALLIVMALALMLLILAATTLMYSSTHFSTSYHQIKRAQALYATEAAIQVALARIKIGQYDLTAPEPWPIAFWFTVDDPTRTLEVYVEIFPIGTDPGTGITPPAGTRAIKATVDY